MTIIEPRTYEQAILQHRAIYPNMTDSEFIAYFAKRYPVVTERQVALVLQHYQPKGGNT